MGNRALLSSLSSRRCRGARSLNPTLGPRVVLGQCAPCHVKIDKPDWRDKGRQRIACGGFSPLQLPAGLAASLSHLSQMRGTAGVSNELVTAPSIVVFCPRPKLEKKTQ